MRKYYRGEKSVDYEEICRRMEMRRMYHMEGTKMRKQEK